VAVKVNIELPQEVQSQTVYDKLRRIDFLGCLMLVCTVGCPLLGFSLKSTEEIPWSHPLIWGLFVFSAVSGVLFVLVEKYWAPYPVMPLRLMTQRTPLAVSIANLFASISAFSMVCFLAEFVSTKYPSLSAVVQCPLIFFCCEIRVFHECRCVQLDLR
jgi:hypothetical protein